MPTRNVLALAFGIVLLACAYTMARPVATAGPPARDFEAYWSAGAAYNAGLDPYSRAIWQFERTVPEVDASRDELLPFIGPPYTLPLWSLLARLPFLGAVAVWRCVLALAAVVAVFGAASLAGLAITPVRGTALVLLGAAFGPLTSAFALGQVALVAFSGIVGALLALRAYNPAWSAAAALVAATQPNIAILLIARLREQRSFVSFGVALAACVAIAVAALGEHGALAYLARLSAHGDAERYVAIQLTPAAILFGLTGTRETAAWLGTIVFAVAVLATLAVAWRLRDGVTRTALACCAAPFVLPFFHEHDLVVMLLPGVVCATRLRGGWLAAASVGTVTAGVDWIGLAQRPTGLVQAIAMSVAVALAFAVMASENGRARLAGLLVPFGVAALGTMAAVHGAPVWPDALPSHFQAPAGAGAADVWAIEQHAAGLDRANPLWALLRLSSLAGCGLVWCSLAAIAAKSPASLRLVRDAQPA